MGVLVNAVKTVISLGGTGVPWVASRNNDPVYNIDLNQSKIAGVSVTAETALNFIPFYAAVRIISEDVAGLPLNVYSRRSDGGRDIDREHPVHKLLHDAPNPEMTAFTWRETAMAHVLTWGNHYSEIEYSDEGTILGLWPLRPDAMEVLRDDEGTLFYRYVADRGKRVDIPARNIFHLHGLGYDGRVGYSVVARMRRAIALGIATETHGTNSFSDGQIPRAVLKTDAKLDPDTLANLKPMMEQWRGLENRHRMAVLEQGLSIDVIGIPNDDAQFIATLENAGGAMATGFRIPPSMLGMVNRSTSWGSGIEQQQIGYATQTLRGWLVRGEQQYNKDLLPGDDNRYVKHVIDGLLRGDSAARWAAYNAGLDRGVWNIDDVREMEDRNPLPDGQGQRHFVQLNMAPLDQIGEMTVQQRIEALGALIRAGFQPAASTDMVQLPAIEHTGLEPVTVAEQGDFSRAKAAPPPAPVEPTDPGALIALGDAIRSLREPPDPPIVNVEAPIINIEPPVVNVPTDTFVDAVRALRPILEHLAEPKTKRILRDKDGRMVGLVDE